MQETTNHQISNFDLAYIAKKDFGKQTLLWLDDIRDPRDNIWGNWIARNVGNPMEFHITWVKSYGEFERYIERGILPDIVCFDHDLGYEHYTVENPDILDYAMFEEKTGYDCAKLLTEICMDKKLQLPVWMIQSSNPVGAENIRSLLINFKKHNG